MESNLREQIIALVDADYQKFSAALIPTINNVLGVRLPELRKIAKTIAQGDWRAFLETAEDEYFEEIMLQGMVLGYMKTDIEELLNDVAAFVPKIDNWSVCDSFCAGLKFTKEHKERVWAFLQPYLSSEREYEVRFAVVMLLNFYIEAEYIERVLQLLDGVKHEGYYAKMAVSWAISMCYIKMPVPTMTYLLSNTLDKQTYNKALQKITESNRIDPAAKSMIRGLKRTL